MNELVSVIVPIYKVEDYLDRCVDSAVNQTYRNLQIILVDDGSPDNCPKMCDEWAKKDNRIQVIHKKNGGLSDARNAGLRRAKGKFIYFFDSDDYIESCTIEKLVKTMEEKNADAVCFGYTKVGEDGKIIRKSELEAGTYSFKTQKEKINFICRVLSQYRIGWEAWSRMYRRDIIVKNKLRFEPNKEVFAEDQCFNLYYTLCSNNIICLEDRFYNYLIRSTSIMGKRTEYKINEMICIVNKLYKLAKKKEMTEIVNNFNYISTTLIVDTICRFEEKDYGYYAGIIKNKKLCKRCYYQKGRHVLYAKIWGIRGCRQKLEKMGNFVKYL